MEPVSPEELIGRYFDGVATAEERLQAERLLTDSQSARNWLTHLEQMNACLADLPKHTMPRDFSTSVLRQAEQAMLINRSARWVAKDAAEQELASSEPLPGISRRQLWAALAVAATALIVVVLPNVLKQRAPQLADRRGAETETRAENRLKELPVEPGEMPTDGMAAYDGIAADDNAPAADSLGIDRRKAPLAKGEGWQRESATPALEPKANVGKQSANADRFYADVPHPSVAAESFGNKLSYVYDVATPEAQQTVLKKFEETLREQQIVLEDAKQTTTMATAPAGGFGGAAPATAGGAGQAVNGALLNPSNPSQDRVYVIEATELQLSNTISTMDDFTAPQSSNDRSLDVGQRREGQAQMAQGIESEVLRPGNTATARSGRQLGSPARQAPPVPAAVQSITGNASSTEGVGYEFNRSQALRLQTDFDDLTRAGKDAAKAPASPAAPPSQTTAATTTPARPPDAPAASAPSVQKPAEPKDQTESTKAGEAKPTASTIKEDPARGLSRRRAESVEQRQRAVIIFRVVPEVSADAQPPK